MPKLRFKEFSSEWEEKKLGEISSKVNKKNKDNLIKNVLTNSAEFGVVSQQRFFDKKIANSNNINSYYISNPNSYIYNPRVSKYAKFGPISRNKLNKPGIVSPLYYVFNTQNNDLYFLDNYFYSSNWHSFVYKNGNSGARSDRISIKDSDLKRLPIKLPNIQEQTKIGEYFSKLDKLIEAQEQKVEQLKQLKRGYLQKMFPQKGAVVPRLRFRGFSGEWEEICFNDIFKEKNHMHVESIDYPLMSFVQKLGVIPKSDRYDRKALVKNMDKKYKITNYDDFIYSSNNFLSGSIGINRTGNAVISPVYSIFKIKNNFNVYYIYAMSSLKLFLYKMSKFKQGVTYGQFKIKEKDFLKIKMCISDIKEQEKIGKMFFKLDKLIELQQQKLSKLQQLKKGYLQKMFC
ncbi:type I site-specific deoxyribonuclease specificity subunit [Apilactobacillus ozensis DSM 23829 = JCM 17196]|uniref:Type I site-specific deoxyribonuclease specificity subunit n=1 Tax=Apilactobacillus ozensis DSM 23829 = JCM 17196 TaxID=1423781 RepID=A0A0R2AKK9_9LACO|nr:type I site-specific deoxyribonuclease specificity subunit [Apilactobacillus ozensis DSM 23829 = JCM 17196]